MNFRLMFLSLCLTLITATTIIAQSSPIGVWKTVDDKTDEAKSHIEIYEQNGKLYGKIVKLLRENAKTIIGLVIVEDLAVYKDYWKKGTIMDPEDGKEYGCSIWFDDGKSDELKVRGKHWTGIYRTQTWYRVK